MRKRTAKEMGKHTKNASLKAALRKDCSVMSRLIADKGTYVLCSASVHL